MKLGFLEHISIGRWQHTVAHFAIACLALTVLTLFCYQMHLNLATASLLYVIVVVLLARICDFVVSLVTSLVAAILLAYIAPPIYSFRIDDPLDVVAVLTFLVVSLTVASLVSRLRVMREEALSSVHRKLVDAEERESSRIGRELHEDISQRLALSDHPNPAIDDHFKTGQREMS
jgi:K+-sensing histidine kinase KdpD